MDQLKKINNQWLFDTAPTKVLHLYSRTKVIYKRSCWLKNSIPVERIELRLRALCICHVLTVIACMLNPSPSCLHATKASLVVQPSLHTLPHRCPTRTSTRPSYCERPPDRRTCNHNLRHVKHSHLTPLTLSPAIRCLPTYTDRRPC